MFRLKTLKARLKKKIEASYLIQGEDILLYDKALEMIKKVVNLVKLLKKLTLLAVAFGLLVLIMQMHLKPFPLKAY